MRYLFIALAWTTVFCTASAQSGWEVLSPLPTSAHLADVHFVDAKFGVAVGQDLPFVQTTDGGVSWSKGLWTTNYDFKAVSFGSAMNGIIVGEYNMRTNDGGLHWEGFGVNADLEDVWFSDAQTATVVGKKVARSSIYRTTDAGGSWLEQYASTEWSLRSVMFVDNDFGWTVGMFGTMLRTTNGGSTWLTLPSVTEAHYYGVAFFDRLQGIVVGDGGTILRTEDGGVTWIAQASST